MLILPSSAGNAIFLSKAQRAVAPIIQENASEIIVLTRSEFTLREKLTLAISGAFHSPMQSVKTLTGCAVFAVGLWLFWVHYLRHSGEPGNLPLLAILLSAPAFVLLVLMILVLITLVSQSVAGARLRALLRKDYKVALTEQGKVFLKAGTPVLTRKWIDCDLIAETDLFFLLYRNRRPFDAIAKRAIPFGVSLDKVRKLLQDSTFGSRCRTLLRSRKE